MMIWQINLFINIIVYDDYCSALSLLSVFHLPSPSYDLSVLFQILLFQKKNITRQAQV